MRLLVVGSYPPRRCGIGAYARAMTDRMRAAGHDVTVLSPPDGEGSIRVPFASGRPFFHAASIGGRFERIVVHFQPSLYYRPRRPLSKILTSLALLYLVVRRPTTEIVVHEADPPLLWRPDYVLLRMAFARARLGFHTRTEAAGLAREYRISPRWRLVAHGEGVLVGDVRRDEARRRLGVEPDEPLFVCAGFVHPAKGFDRAIEAFRRAGSPGRLVIVGSVRDPLPTNLRYMERLRRMAGDTPGAQVVDEFISDEEFDAWVAAADRILLPYTRSWSSGALARAQALGTPAVVSSVGGLAEQAGPGDIVVRDDAELAKGIVDAVPAGVRR